MRRYRGGEQVTRGIYLGLASGEFFQSPAHGTALPGGRERAYLRMPVPLVLLVVPLMGLGFVVFLPLVGLVGLLAFVAHRLARLAVRGAQEVAQVAVPTWVPGVSYLARGRRGKERRAPEPSERFLEEAQQFLGELEEELRERRHKGEK